MILIMMFVTENYILISSIMVGAGGLLWLFAPESVKYGICENDD